MANAMICDRCGKIYPGREKCPEIGIFTRSNERRCEAYKDLCDDCINALHEFMEPTESESKIGFDLTNQES